MVEPRKKYGWELVVCGEVVGCTAKPVKKFGDYRKQKLNDCE
jgi:hypothetical protein